MGKRPTAEQSDRITDIAGFSKSWCLFWIPQLNRHKITLIFIRLDKQQETASSLSAREPKQENSQVVNLKSPCSHRRKERNNGAASSQSSTKHLISTNISCDCLTVTGNVLHSTRTRKMKSLSVTHITNAGEWTRSTAGVGRPWSWSIMLEKLPHLHSWSFPALDFIPTYRSRILITDQSKDL